MRAHITTGAVLIAATLTLAGCSVGGEDQAPGEEGESSPSPSPTETSTLPPDEPGEEWSASMDAPDPGSHLKADATWPDPYFEGRSPWTSETEGADVWAYYDDGDLPQVAAVGVIFPGEEQCSVVGSSPKDVMTQLSFQGAYNDLVNTTDVVMNNDNQVTDLDGSARPVDGSEPEVGADEGTLYSMPMNAVEDPTGPGKAATGWASIVQEEEGRYSTNACALTLTERTAEHDDFQETPWASAVQGAEDTARTLTMRR